MAKALEVQIEEIFSKHAGSPQESAGYEVHAEVLRKASCLILGAGPVPSGVGTFNSKLIGMVPLLGTPILIHQIRYLNSLGFDHFVVGVPKVDIGMTRIIHAVFPKISIQFHPEPNPEGVGMSAAVLAKVAQDNDRSQGLVVLGDTLFSFKDMSQLDWSKPFVLSDEATLPHRWATIEEETPSGLLSFHEKNQALKSLRGARAHALVGVYWFPALAKMEAVALRIPERPIEMSYVLNRIDPRPRAVRVGEWYDIGHADTYMESQQALLSSRGRVTRRFNQVDIDPWNGTLTKRIDQAYAGPSEVQKFLDEIAYYRLLPEDLKILFPRVVKESTVWEDPFLTLEYYGMGTLADLYLFDTGAHPELWSAIFERVAFSLDSLHAIRRPRDRDAMRDMYVNKTQERLSRLQTSADSRLDAVINSTSIRINGVESPGLRIALGEINSDIEVMIAQDTEFSVIVGDACFSNILFDIANGICRFCDPRGSFGRLTGYMGDPAYDIAKLVHSVEGLYDSIVNDLFTVEARGHEFNYLLYSPPQREQIVSYFNEMFFDDPRRCFGASRRDILLINVLLFASMIPLHNGFPDRQLMMALRALYFYQVFQDGSAIIER